MDRVHENHVKIVVMLNRFAKVINHNIIEEGTVKGRRLYWFRFVWAAVCSSIAFLVSVTLMTTVSVDIHVITEQMFLAESTAQIAGKLWNRIGNDRHFRALINWLDGTYSVAVNDDRIKAITVSRLTVANRRIEMFIR